MFHKCIITNFKATEAFSISNRPPADLFCRDEEYFVPSLLDALLGACDTDVGAGVVGTRNSDLGGRLQLQLLQLLAVLTDDKSMVLLGDGDRS